MLNPILQPPKPEPGTGPLKLGESLTGLGRRFSFGPESVGWLVPLAVFKTAVGSLCGPRKVRFLPSPLPRERAAMRELHSGEKTLTT